VRCEVLKTEHAGVQASESEATFTSE
jgi:hypothetical protein